MKTSKKGRKPLFRQPKSGRRRLASGSRFSARFARPPPPLGTQRNRTRQDKRVKAGFAGQGNMKEIKRKN